MKINPLTAIDFYKADHRRQYPDGTTKVYSNFTPRSSHLANVIRDRYDETIVFFGLQGFCKWFLIDCWNEEFFNKPKDEVLRKYKRRMDNALGPDAISVEHISALHDLGYLPIRIKALPEGSRVPIKVPVLTVENTHPDFFWLTNYLESIMSAELWKSSFVATIANEYRKMLNDYADFTGAPKEFVPFQGHDFSFRGMSGLHDAVQHGVGHLTSFVGTDTVPAIDFAEDYYNANSDNELVGCSVPATEHSVMCMGTKNGEIDTFRRLITELYPSGIVSIVSDTWDYWQVLTDFMVQLKDDILNRTPDALGNAKLVCRPDSGDPVKIICGDPDAPLDSPEHKGSLECLWEVFGGTYTEAGYRVLNPRVGLIYGDSITLERCRAILARMAEAGFASCNIVFGIGSFTYQFATRDSFGWAMKATYGEVNGVGREIFKDPKTDSGTKKSAKGLLRVELVDGQYVLFDQQTPEESEKGCLTEVFRNGRMTVETSLAEIRKRIEQ